MNKPKLFAWEYDPGYSVYTRYSFPDRDMVAAVYTDLTKGDIHWGIEIWPSDYFPNGVYTSTKAYESAEAALKEADDMLSQHYVFISERVNVMQ